jgi:hypothetical protein
MNLESQRHLAGVVIGVKPPDVEGLVVNLPSLAGRDLA